MDGYQASLRPVDGDLALLLTYNINGYKLLKKKILSKS